MTVLILGARGMLGTVLAEVFRDVDPTCWDREELDITDAEAVHRSVSQQAPQVIINAAAYTDVDGAQEQRELAFAVNEHGVRILATVARQIGATVIHYSTDYVFPGTKRTGYTEDDNPGPPVNTYGESKLAGERALREIAPAFYLIRSAWLYGPYGNNFVDTMLTLADKQPQIRVVNDQYGSPTYTRDLAAATRELLEGGFMPGVYHLVNEGQTTWYDFTREIFRRTGAHVSVQPVPSSEFPRPAPRPRYSMLQNTRGPRLRPWPQALDDYLKRR